MDELFSADFFAGNRARLLSSLEADVPIVVTANGLLQRNSDNTFAFRQDSNFWYLTGIDEADAVLVMDKGKEYLVVPPRDDVRAAFDGAVDYTALSRRSGIETILSEDEGWKKIAERAEKTGEVATLGTPPAYNDRNGFYVNPSRARLIKRLKSLREGLETLDLRPNLMHLRVNKQPEELQALQRAIDITIDGLKYVTAKPQLSKYEYEFEVEADLVREFRRRGASGPAYGSIVAGGQRACMLHNMANEAALDSKDLLLMDVGAEASNYAADLTRTISLNGRPTTMQKAVHDAVVSVQDFALTLLKPGVLMKEYEAEVELFMGEKLRELGVIKNVDRESVRTFYPHAASHFLGLDVHDVGDYTQPLEAGMVLTCEPGIYIPAEGIGVRIEDDILITPEGNEVLSKALSRSL